MASVEPRVPSRDEDVVTLRILHMCDKMGISCRLQKESRIDPCIVANVPRDTIDAP